MYGGNAKKSTSGQLLLIAEKAAMVALIAQTKKYYRVSMILPRLIPNWQLNGIMKRMTTYCPQRWYLEVIKKFGGNAKSMAMNGKQSLIAERGGMAVLIASTKKCWLVSMMFYHKTLNLRSSGIPPKTANLPLPQLLLLRVRRCGGSVIFVDTNGPQSLLIETEVLVVLSAQGKSAIKTNFCIHGFTPYFTVSFSSETF